MCNLLRRLRPRASVATIQDRGSTKTSKASKQSKQTKTKEALSCKSLHQIDKTLLRWQELLPNYAKFAQGGKRAGWRSWAWYLTTMHLTWRWAYGCVLSSGICFNSWNMHCNRCKAYSKPGRQAFVQSAFFAIYENSCAILISIDLTNVDECFRDTCFTVGVFNDTYPS